VAVAFDQAAGTLIPGGRDDETISARAGRLRFEHPYSWGLLARALDTISPGHCERAIEHDRQRAEAVAKLEEESEKEGLGPL
jgi:hypothetical protein